MECWLTIRSLSIYPTNETPSPKLLCLVRSFTKPAFLRIEEWESHDIVRKARQEIIDLYVPWRKGWWWVGKIKGFSLCWKIYSCSSTGLSYPNKLSGPWFKNSKPIFGKQTMCVSIYIYLCSVKCYLIRPVLAHNYPQELFLVPVIGYFVNPRQFQHFCDGGQVGYVPKQTAILLEVVRQPTFKPCY